MVAISMSTASPITAFNPSKAPVITARKTCHSLPAKLMSLLSGREITDTTFDRLAARTTERDEDNFRNSPIFRELNPSERRGEEPAKTGLSKLKRAAFISTLVRDAGKEGWGKILDSLSRQSSFAQIAYIFYSEGY